MKMTNGIFKKIIFVLFFVVAPYSSVNGQDGPSFSDETTQIVVDEKELQKEVKEIVDTRSEKQNEYIEVTKKIAQIEALGNEKTDTNYSSYKSKQDQLFSEIQKTSNPYDLNVFQEKARKARIIETLDTLSKVTNKNEAQKALEEKNKNDLLTADLLITEAENRAKQAALNAEKDLPQVDPFSCWKSWSVFPDLDCVVAKFVYWVPYKISENLLKLSGIVFDYVIEFTIVNMKANIYGAAGTNSAIEVAWVIFRDIANILFIFALIYIAIKTILQGTSQTAKSIGTVIIVAVLINFSLFFTKVVIDVTNTAAISFYNSIVETVGTAATPRDKDIYASNGRSLAEAIIMQTGIASSYKVSNGVLAGGWMSIAKQLLLTAAVFLIVAIVLFLAVFLLITRFIILAVVMLLSSLAFGSYIFPKLRTQISDKWWSALIGQSFVAPVFLVMLFITFKIMGAINITTSTTGNGFGDFFTLQPDILLKYTLVIGMLIFSIKTAKTLSDQAGGMAGTITKTLGGLALGGLALGSRTIVGGAASKIASKMDPTSALGGFAKRRLEGVSNSSFDIRNSRLGGSVIKQSGLDMGKPAKDASFTAESAKRAANAKKRAESISNEVDASDPQKRTHREIYESSVMRIATGGGSRRRQVIDKRDIGEKLERAKRDHKIALAAATDPGGTSYSVHKNNAKSAETELAALKGALAIAIGGGTGNPATIRTDIQRQETILANSQTGMEAIEKSTGMKESFQKVANLQAKYDNIGKGKETTQEDISKQLERLIENSRK